VNDGVGGFEQGQDVVASQIDSVVGDFWIGGLARFEVEGND
jgi:hypothetical protein